MDEHTSALDVAKEIVAQAFARMSAFDQARYVCQNQAGFTVQRRNAEIGLQGKDIFLTRLALLSDTRRLVARVSEMLVAAASPTAFGNLQDLACLGQISDDFGSVGVIDQG